MRVLVLAIVKHREYVLLSALADACAGKQHWMVLVLGRLLALVGRAAIIVSGALAIGIGILAILSYQPQPHCFVANMEIRAGQYKVLCASNRGMFAAMYAGPTRFTNHPKEYRILRRLDDLFTVISWCPMEDELRLGRFRWGTLSMSAGGRRLLLPLWMPIVCLTILPAVGFFRGPLCRFQRRRSGLCPACAYNLRGNTAGICPECGHRAVGCCRRSGSA